MSMKVSVRRVSDDYELNVRYTDEIAEHEGMSDEQLGAMEARLRKGIFYLSSDVYLKHLKLGEQS